MLVYVGTKSLAKRFLSQNIHIILTVGHWIANQPVILDSSLRFVSSKNRSLLEPAKPCSKNSIFCICAVSIMRFAYPRNIMIHSILGLLFV